MWWCRDESWKRATDHDEQVASQRRRITLFWKRASQRKHLVPLHVATDENHVASYGITMPRDIHVDKNSVLFPVFQLWRDCTSLMTRWRSYLIHRGIHFADNNDERDIHNNVDHTTKER